MRIYGNNCKVKQTQGAQGIISLRTLRNLGKLCVYCILIFNARISMLKVKYYFQFIRKLFSITKGVCL